jgi:hypothetical protein
MPDLSTDAARDELDSIWHQLGNLDEPGPSMVIALKRVILVTRGLLRRVDELQVEVSLMKKGTRQ